MLRADGARRLGAPGPPVDASSGLGLRASSDAPTGRSQGGVNFLVADKLLASPRLYATFPLWVLSELYERLPER